MQATGTQMQLFMSAEPNWDSVSDRELRDLALLPIGGIPDGPNKASQVATWLQANRVAYSRIAKAEIDSFKQIGTAQKWFSEWNPASPLMRRLSDAIEEAYDVVSRHYPAIESRGLNTPEDMGLLASKGLGGSEGILAKYSPYDRSCLHLEIHAVTGPLNHCPGEKVEFEEGAESHVFHLAYTDLPSLETLLSDLCTYPLIRLPENIYRNKYGKPVVYQSEGFIGKLAKTGIPVHCPWKTLTPMVQAGLMALLG